MFCRKVAAFLSVGPVSNTSKVESIFGILQRVRFFNDNLMKFKSSTLNLIWTKILSRLVNSCFVYLSYIVVCEEDRNSYFMPCVSWNVKLTFFVWVGHSPQTVLTLSRCILNPSPFALDYFSFSVISTLGDVMLHRKRFEISLCGLNQAWGRFIRIYGYHWWKKITSFQGPTLRKVHKNEKRKFTSM